MDRPDKTTLRRIWADIDRVLWEVWDPIGVNDEPGAIGEYSSYVGEVYRLLTLGAEDAAIQKYLSYVTEVRMGMGPGKGDESETISALRAIDLT